MATPPSPDALDLAELERRAGGRVGFFALDTATGRALAHRAEERFPMCSTFKWFLAAAILARVDRGELALDGRIAFGPADLLEHAPVARRNVDSGSLTVEALTEAIVTVSDNTAANLLLRRYGGPAALTALARSLGDPTTQFDRDEPALNEHTPGDARDTTTPRAMVSLMRAVLCGDALSPASRARLLAWLRACETGRERLRAGLPATWTVGDKTGTGPRGSVHDLAIAWPPDQAPRLIAAYLSGSTASVASLAKTHAELGRLVAHAL